MALRGTAVGGARSRVELPFGNELGRCRGGAGRVTTVADAAFVAGVLVAAGPFLESQLDSEGRAYTYVFFAPYSSLVKATYR